MEQNLFSNDDLKELFKELEENSQDTEENDPEMEASQRRYMEIIKKHKEQE